MQRRELLKAAAGAAVGLIGTGYFNAASAQTEVSLRSLADKKGFRFGSAIDYQNLKDEWLKDLYRRHCNSLTARNALKWVGTERSPGKFGFDEADAIIAFAEAEGMKSYGHTLVWKNVPGWVSRIKNAAEARRVMLRHVRTVVGHFKGRVDAWVSGVGSAGTFTGVARFLKKRLPETLCVAVEPQGSILQGGTPGPHKVEGIGVSFIPATFDPSVCDRVMRVTDPPAFAMVKRLAAEAGVFAGSSAGAMVQAALELAGELGPEKRVVTVIPDSAERYLSKGLLV